jgi:hypothetical protein
MMPGAKTVTCSSELPLNRLRTAKTLSAGPWAEARPEQCRTLGSEMPGAGSVEPNRNRATTPRVVEVAQHVRNGQGPRLAMPAQVGQLVPAVRGQRHHRHDPGAQAGEREHDELPAVRQLDDDPVAAG